MTTTQTTTPTTPTTRTNRPIRMRGIEIEPRVTAAETDGALSVLAQRVEPGAGSPPHRCLGQTKAIAVVEGQFDVALGQTTVAAAAGDVVLVPPGERHGFTNVGATTGRLLVTLTPGGHEEFLAALAGLGGPANADPVELAALCARHRVALRD